MYGRIVFLMCTAFIGAILFSTQAEAATYRVPLERASIATALLELDVTEVIVAPEWNEHGGIVIPPGVYLHRDYSIAGAPPTISGAFLSTPVTFREDAGTLPGTILDGFEIINTQFLGPGIDILPTTALPAAAPIEIRNCTIQLYPVGGVGILVRRGANVLISNCTIDGGTDDEDGIGLYGIHLAQAFMQEPYTGYSVLIEKTIIRDCLRIGIWNQMTENVLTVRDNTIYNILGFDPQLGWTGDALFNEGGNVICDRNVLTKCRRPYSGTNCGGFQRPQPSIIWDYDEFLCGGMSIPPDINSNPFFCDLEDLTVHINSPCIASGDLIGAKGVGCASNYLSNALTTLTADNTDPNGVRLTADLIVPGPCIDNPTRSLVIGSGVRFVADTTDAWQGLPEDHLGLDDLKCEIIVYGDLSVDGATFEGYRGQEGDWFGIYIDHCGTLSMENAQVRHADFGVVSGGDARIVGSLFEENVIYDIKVSSTAPCEIEGNTIYVGGGSGLEVAGSDVVVEDNFIYGNGVSVAGIEITEAQGQSEATPVIRGNYIHSFSYGYPIFAKGASAAQIEENGIYASQYGIYVQRGTPRIGSSSSSSDNVIIGNSYGVFARPVGGGACPAQLCAPIIRNNSFEANGKGVVIERTYGPNLGSVGDPGNNYFSGNTYACIWNGSSCGSVSARGNFFNYPYDPPCTVVGAVDTTGQLSVPPLSVPVEVEAVDRAEGPDALRVRVEPNPARENVTVRVSAGSEALCETSIYDVTGRVVRRLGEALLHEGANTIRWDGKDSQGGRVAGGIFYVEIRSGVTRAISRVVVIN